jgi:genome maintenance exonuclease 1
MFTHIHHDIQRIQRVETPEGRLYETPSGKRYPSVTSVTGLLGKEAIIAWRKRVGEAEANRISTRAANRGTRIHSLCESYLNNEHVEPDIFDAETWSSFKPVLTKVNNIHCLETPLYSDHLQVAGTVDCIAEYEGKLAVIDFKTSSRVKRRDDIHNYFMQCSAYAVAFEERTGISIPNIVILMSVDNEPPLIFHEKRNQWINSFIDLRNQFFIERGY